jgi:hypothetical protein
MKQTARMRLAIYCAAAITATVLGHSTAAAQEGASPAPIPTPKAEVELPPKGTRRDTYPFRGVIAAIDIQAKRLTLEGKQNRRVIHVTNSTRFEKQGQTVVLADLKVGEAIGGTLRKTAAGQEEALLVRLNPKTVPPTAEVTVTNDKENGRAPRE